MFRLALLFTACIALICSCKKSKNNDPDTPIDPVITPVYPNYMAMKPGNYWIYQQYLLDSANGNASAENVFDSCYVEKDTVINGKTYHKYLAAVFGGGGTHSVQYLRDSSSYVVTERGRILFSSDDFTHIFFSKGYFNPAAGAIDTIPFTERMDHKDMQVTVPAGTFKTSTFRQEYYMPEPKYHYGPIRSYDYSYAENIGLVKATTAWYFSMPMIYERRLVRYHVQ